MKDLLPCRIWILVSAWATLAGWSLGLSGNISRAGYAGTLLPLVLLLAFLWHKNCPDVAVGYAKKCNTPFRLIRYFKRSWRGISHVSFWLPVLFIFVALLTFAGGALSAPNNYDALSYRLPRILRWIEDGRWSWIDTSNPRQNYSAPGFEWQMLPLAIFGKTDRLFFLINWISFLLLPSLVFRTFRLTGLPKQTCWWWMWILPLGYGYVLQAGSVGNDGCAVVYALASVCFVFSANKGLRFHDFGWSILSVALLTGTKGSNLPLILPWFVAMILRVRLWLPQFFKLIPWALVGLAVSFIPIAIINHLYAGKWNGDPFNASHMQLTAPAAGILGNSLMMGYACLQPPLNPCPELVNLTVNSFIRPDWGTWLHANFPRFTLKFGELPMEESAGLGLGVTACLVLWILWSKRIQAPRTSPKSQSWFFLGFAGFISLVFFMAKMGSESTGRLLLPYYPFLLMIPLGVFHAARNLGFIQKMCFLLCSSFVLFGLILSPARPLLPWSVITAELFSLDPLKDSTARLNRVIKTYATRSVGLRSMIPLNLEKQNLRIGLINRGDDPDGPLWWPWGLRHVRSFSPDNAIQSLAAQSPDLLLARESDWLSLQPHLPADWRVVFTSRLTLKASEGDESWVTCVHDKLAGSP